MEEQAKIGEPKDVVEFPVLETYESNSIDKDSVPPEGIVVNIVKVKMVTTKFLNKRGEPAKKLVVTTDKGDFFPRWSEVEKIKTWYGNNTINWKNRTLRLKVKDILVRNEDRKTFVVEKFPPEPNDDLDNFK